MNSEITGDSQELILLPVLEASCCDSGCDDECCPGGDCC